MKAEAYLPAHTPSPIKKKNKTKINEKKKKRETRENKKGENKRKKEKKKSDLGQNKFSQVMEFSRQFVKRVL